MAELIDLTLALEHRSIAAMPPFPSPIIRSFIEHSESITEGYGTPDDRLSYTVTFLSLLDHVGTHVDAPRHNDPSGLAIDECPLQWFSGQAVCLDLSGAQDRSLITDVQLTNAERTAGVTIDGHIVLLYTGFHDRHWPNPSVLTDNAGLTDTATHWLADRGSRVHGVEGPSTDLSTSPDYPSHRASRDRGMIHYEWLVNLRLLVGRGVFTFFGYPLKIVCGSGSPVRALAQV